VRVVPLTALPVITQTVTAISIEAGLTLVAFICYLIFCTVVVLRTGDTAGLRDVAMAVRAFAQIGTFHPVALRARQVRCCFCPDPGSWLRCRRSAVPVTATPEGLGHPGPGQRPGQPGRGRRCGRCPAGWPARPEPGSRPARAG
jgi:hypothetical protein